MTTKDKTIFITIPAYNDVSLTRTIDLAISNALYPENLYFCIGMQYDDDLMPDMSKYANNPNFDIVYYDVSSRPGVYWIRREMSQRHRDQDYFLMIDSHMSFAKYWDAKLINDYQDLQRFANKKEVIISRPTMAEVGSTTDNSWHSMDDVSCWIVNWDNDKNNIQRTILPWMKTIPWSGDRYIKTYYACSHFFFTNKDYIYDVGFFDILRSYCEEYTISLTNFLSGWDCYMMPEYILIGHDDADTHIALYGREKYTIAQGKDYQAIFETDDQKKELAKFLFSDDSKLFKVRNQRRSINDFYREAGDGLEEARQIYLNML